MKLSMSRPVGVALAVLVLAGAGWVARERLTGPRALPEGLI